MEGPTMIKTVCVDLDGVLAQYDGWKGVEHIGDPIPGAREFVMALCALPSKVCIHTTRTNPVANKGKDGRELRLLVEDWLIKHDFPYDSIACGEGKPLAVAYIDDRAVVCRPLKDDAYDFDRALAEARGLVKDAPLGGVGTFSDGKLNEEDEGDVRLALTSSGDGLVRIDFGKPVAWLALPSEQARQLANTLLKHANR